MMSFKRLIEIFEKLKYDYYTKLYDEEKEQLNEIERGNTSNPAITQEMR